MGIQTYHFSTHNNLEIKVFVHLIMEENEIISPKCETIAEPECNYLDTGTSINLGSLNRNLLDSDISIGNHKDIEAVDGFPTLNHLETPSSIPKKEELCSNKDAEKVTIAS